MLSLTSIIQWPVLFETQFLLLSGRDGISYLSQPMSISDMNGPNRPQENHQKISADPLFQFFDRLKLFGMPEAPAGLSLDVPLRKVHLFTSSQLTCLVLLWAIKASPAAIVFP